MKKLLVTLRIGDYEPQIWALTRPLMESYAMKCGMEFHVITERKLTADGDGKPLNYEKFQVQDLCRDFDWTAFIDADALISPDTPDWSEMVNDKGIVLFNGIDNRLDRFRASNYSCRSGSKVGACTWNVWCSDWTGPDLWQPPADFKEAVKNISLMWQERGRGIARRRISSTITSCRRTSPATACGWPRSTTFASGSYGVGTATTSTSTTARPMRSSRPCGGGWTKWEFATKNRLTIPIWYWYTYWCKDNHLV